MRTFSWAVVAGLTIAAAPAPAARLEARSPHFIVYSEGGEPASRDLATKLERFDQGTRRLRDLPDDPSKRFSPLAVYVRPDMSAVGRRCAQDARGTTACTNGAGFYSGHAARSVAFTPRRSGTGRPLDPDALTILFHGGLRLLLARQHPGEKTLGEARAALLPLALDPRADPDNPAARLIARIEAADPAVGQPPNDEEEKQ